MLRVNKSRCPPGLLCLSNHLKGERRFTRGFRAINLANAAFRQATYTQRNVQTE